MAKSTNLPILLLIAGAMALSVQEHGCDCVTNICDCGVLVDKQLKEGTFYQNITGILEVVLIYEDSELNVDVEWNERYFAAAKLTVPYKKKPACGQFWTMQRRLELCVFLSHVKDKPKHGIYDRALEGDLYYYITYGEKKIVPDSWVGGFDMPLPYETRNYRRQSDSES